MSLHTTCTIVNNSTFPLVPITSHFKAGEWIVPPATVPERSSIVFSARPSTRSLGRLEWAQHFELRINEIHHIDISLVCGLCWTAERAADPIAQASERHFAAQTSKTSTAAAIFSKSLNDTFDAQSRARRVTISPEHYLTIHPETGWHRFVLYADPKNCSFALTFAPEKLTEELQV